ncbi:MAG: hypothetical protein COV59_02365 [Candidatus Magasanikbacteria bacterium CG11_big_fil_rev_8_21_14_0_20_39_34]|uniref:DUF8128 domain-containing protein n=1 Tax=Candidatus Magasanikbacteria bacterium CG11_big_fil_rev_8_21_14_0_20_39_34 TaxID=1974653 RepID=A0A2H0N7B5_9BACT|nr:MAG: hypothetical protein COV59_02365 [Candidatus Magasanikbacteria bacterium CG11_big_fil_rev_8_21_14_0_20_39_34]
MDQILLFVTQSPIEAILQIFVLGGWLVFFWAMLHAGLLLLGAYKSILYTKGWNWTLLAIDIPAINIQTPKAVEQLFSHIYSVMEPPSIATVFGRGFTQFSYSFEIVSIEGYIQFIIRTLDIYRDVVEAAVYAQYPEAEITEIEDYTQEMPTQYPNDTYNMWATEFGLTQDYAFPIRSYHDFEHSISKDTVLKDPMGTFLESFSRIGPGEQMWYQMIIEPTPESAWKPKCIKKIKEVIGEKSKSSGGFLSGALGDVLGGPLKFLETAGDQILGRVDGGSAGSSGGDDGPPNQILFLTPGKKKILEAMEDKISKIGFKTKLRAVYVARKEVYNPARGVNSLVGAVNQFNNPYSNMLLPKYLTSTRYFFAEKRKNYRRRILMSAYKSRDMYMGGKQPYVLNLEELATIWHFPMSHVKTPLIQKSETKRSEPPSGLPLEQIGLGGNMFDGEGEKSISSQKNGDTNPTEQKKPYITDSGYVFDDDVRFG